MERPNVSLGAFGTVFRTRSVFDGGWASFGPKWAENRRRRRRKKIKNGEISPTQSKRCCFVSVFFVPFFRLEEVWGAAGVGSGAQRNNAGRAHSEIVDFFRTRF